MLLNKKFDLIFGIGEACSCSQALRKCRLQYSSYPFDWLFGSDILTRVKIFTNDYKGFIDLEDLEDFGQTNKDEAHLCEIYYNKKNNIRFNHDFPYGKPLQESHPKVKEKYDRRAARQFKQIEQSKKVLAVYVQIPNNRQEVEDKTLIEVRNLIQKRFPEQEITLLYLYCNHENKDFKLKEIAEGVVKAEFDYDAYNKDFPFEVNGKALRKLFCKLKISTKFMDSKNLLRRIVFVIKCFFRGML